MDNLKKRVNDILIPFFQSTFNSVFEANPKELVSSIMDKKQGSSSNGGK
jgi:hypothetical protein